MTDETRSYRMQRRAEAQEQTRLRITESAVALHGSVGPARTSMSAVAEHAGVTRSTLYRHFADEAALFAACSAHWNQANPPPDLQAWAAVRDPGERLRVALAELYAFYDRAAPMLSNLIRDEPVVPEVARHFAGFHWYLAAAADVLLAGRAARGARRRRVRAALGHAVAFSTWTSLVQEQSLAAGEAVVLVTGLVEAA